MHIKGYWNLCKGSKGYCVSLNVWCCMFTCVNLAHIYSVIVHCQTFNNLNINVHLVINEC